MEKDSESSSESGSSKKIVPPGLLTMATEHADWLDMMLMASGTAGCIVNGLSMSLIMLTLSQMFNDYASSASITLTGINQYALIYIYIAILVSSGAFIQGFCWGHTAERQSSRIRIKYLKAVLRQEIGYFDETLEASRVVTNISSDISVNIQGVLSEKIPDFLASLCMFLTVELTAAYLCWRLAIVALPAMFLLTIPGAIYGNSLSKNEEKLQEAYAVAGGIAEQAFSLIKTVHSYVGEKKMVERFSIALVPTLVLGIKQGLLKGIVFGSIGIIFSNFALMSWYGSILITKHGIKGGDVFSAGVCIVYGGFGLGASLMNIKHFAEAKMSAALVNEIINRVPSIDSTDKHGTTISVVKGELQFKEVDFAYPSRPECLVLKKVNIKVNAGQTVGLVGQSGSGKSTMVNLLERFYDPTEGVILLDGIDIKLLQLKWLRSQMGLVSQEPILFATTIKENILFGKEGATGDEIIEAAKKANAHNFIMQLPNAYNTMVGEMGAQMSGGQKQRISIARALLREPKILLLDEATSSLDSHSEKAVQEALTQASVGRTTITIAHRIATIRDADLIVVISSGKVIETGSHEELVNGSGPYSMMVHVQKSTVMNSQTTQTSSPTEKVKESPLPEETADEQKVTEFHFKEVVNRHSDEVCSQPSWGDLMQMTRPEWKSTLIGTIGALISGSVQPLFACLLAVMLSVFFLTDQAELRSQTRTLCYVFLTVSVSSIFSNVIQHYYFGIMGENLTVKIRSAIFEKIMTFEIEWFDQEDNSTGALCSRLSTDTLMVRNLVADRLAFFAQSISAAVLAIIWGMTLSWRLASIAVTLQLFIIGSFYLKVVVTNNMSKKILIARNKSSGIAREAVSNQRVITAYYSQNQVMRLYEDTQQGPKKESKKQPVYAGMALLTRQFLTTMNFAVLYWYGGKLLYNGDITYRHLLQTFYIVVTAGILIAEAGNMSGDISAGTNALAAIFTLLRRDGKMETDPTDPLKVKMVYPEKINGQIELKQVEFAYLTRPTKMVLNGLSLKIEAREVTALVGISGSGKSTIIGMIQRFYDPVAGSVEVDGVNISCYNVKALRSFIAWVGQEPSLFAGTVKENIAYGKQNATEAEVIQAATLANIHEFICSMKDGYDTICGERGIQLSGGQKQRIAIARAILKNPAILLLDEPTSALDYKSETIIEDALKKTMVGRTCVIAAHRLSTVKRSNKIVVLDNGSVVEEGSHDDLVFKGEKSAYFSLFKAQQQSFQSNKEIPN